MNETRTLQGIEFYVETTDTYDREAYFSGNKDLQLFYDTYKLSRKRSFTL